MASYNIVWKKSARKELDKIDKKIILKILDAIEKLAKDPRPTQSKKLIGSHSTFRIRVNDYRIIYDVYDKKIEIQVIKIGHRKSVYKTLVD